MALRYALALLLLLGGCASAKVDTACALGNGAGSPGVCVKRITFKSLTKGDDEAFIYQDAEGKWSPIGVSTKPSLTSTILGAIGSAAP